MSIFSQQPTDFSMLFLDMDSYFASCEQQLNPALRYKPVGVTPQLVESGCIIAASIEAKKRGAKTGMPVYLARKNCPDLILVEARPALYKQIHYQIASVLNKISPFVDPRSIDEFSMKLSPSEQNFFAARDIASKIKSDLKKEIGQYITTSVGIGPNYFLAKMAGEMSKPNGFGFMTVADAPSKLADLDLTDLTGISGGISRRLRAEGVHHIGQLYQMDQLAWRRMLGFNGLLWWYRLRGYEIDDVQFNRSNIGHSHVLAPEWRHPEKARQVLNRLAHKVGQRLRNESFWAKKTTLLIHYVNHTKYENYTNTMPYCDSHTITELANRLFDLRPDDGEYIIQLALTASDLVTGTVEPEPLFPEVAKTLHLTRALDTINDKYGRDTIYNGSMMSAKQTAPDRIPFGRVRY
ncbi:MAG: DNA polymerase IV [Patescibacteria group bacterium]|jgi:DNA polymerase-4